MTGGCMTGGCMTLCDTTAASAEAEEDGFLSNTKDIVTHRRRHKGAETKPKHYT